MGVILPLEYESTILSEKVISSMNKLSAYFLTYGVIEILRFIILGVYRAMMFPYPTTTINALVNYYKTLIMLTALLDLLVTFSILLIGFASREFGDSLGDSLFKKSGLPLIAHGTIRVMNDLYLIFVSDKIIEIIFWRLLRPEEPLSADLQYIMHLSDMFNLAILIFGVIAFGFLGYVIIFISENYREFTAMKLPGAMILIGAFLLFMQIGGLIILVGAIIAWGRIRKISCSKELNGTEKREYQ